MDIKIRLGDSFNSVTTIEEAMRVLKLVSFVRIQQLSDQGVLNYVGRCVMNALYFLCRGSPITTLSIALSILEVEGPRITINSRLGLLQLHAIELEAFKIIVVTSTKHTLSLLRNVDAKSALAPLFSKLSSLINIQSAFSIIIAQTMYLILKKHLSPASVKELQYPLICLASKVVAVSPYGKAVEYLSNVAEIFIKSWPKEKRKCLLQRLCDTYVWNNFSCSLMGILIGTLNQDELKYHLQLVMRRLSTMLNQKNLSKSALSVLKALLKKVELSKSLNLLPILLQEVPKDYEERTSFTKCILMECMHIFIENYKLPLYEKLQNALPKDNWLHFAVRVLGLFHCVKLNLLDVQKARVDMVSLYFATENSDLHHYVIQTACHFKDSHQLVEVWQLDLVKIYLQDIMYLPGDYCFNDLWSLASQMCIIANTSTKYLHLYSEFIIESYNYCMINLLSQCPDRIEMAGKIYQMIENTFSEDSTHLKTKYKLLACDRFDRKKAKLYVSLVKNNQWPFSQEATYRALFKEFHRSVKFFPTICAVMNRCPQCFVPANCFQLGLELLLVKYDFEAVAKGVEYVKISNLDPDEKRRQIFERWTARITKLLCTEKSFEMLEKTPIYGLSACMHYLLKQEQAFDYETTFRRCMETISFLLGLPTRHDYSTVDSCLIKAIEHTIVVLNDMLLLIVEMSSKSDLAECCLNTASAIIEHSNMKKPVVASAGTVREICSGDYAGVVAKFHSDVLTSICTEQSQRNVRIRRNPEHRLMIHSIVTGSQKTNNFLLNHTMQSLLAVLSNPSLSSYSTTSALNAIEILVADNSLRSSMLPYIPSIMTYCLKELSNEDWNIRNATIQVFQALVNKILGQKTNSLYRRNTLEDTFALFPSLVDCFYENLSSTNVEEHNSVIGTLALFSEANSKTSFVMPSTTEAMDRFIAVLVNVVISNEGPVGVYAAKALAGLYPHVYIPYMIQHSADWLIANFQDMNKNIFRNCYRLMQDLNEKFEAFVNVSYYKAGARIIHVAFNDLFDLLRGYNSQYEASLFSLLGIKLNSVDEIIQALPERLEALDFESRLWLRNNVPCVLANVNIARFCDILKICLNCQLVFVLEYSLSAILDRFDDLCKESLINLILKIVLDRFFQQFTYTYVNSAFSHVLLLLIESSKPNNINLSAYKFKPTDDLHTRGIYIVLLSFGFNHSDAQPDLIKQALRTYRNVISSEDENLIIFVSTTLKYLFKCVEKVDRSQVLELAFVLLPNGRATNEISSLLKAIFNIDDVLNVRTCFDVLLSYEHLLELLKTQLAVCEYFANITVLVLTLKESFYDCGKFYIKEGLDIYFNKQFLRQLLIEKIGIAFWYLSEQYCVDLMHDLIKLLQHSEHSDP